MAGMLRVAGYVVIHNPSIGVKFRMKDVKRSMKERLFSLPWHPFQKTKRVVDKYLDQAVYFAPHQGVIYVNTSLLPKLTTLLLKGVDLEDVIEYI